MGYCNGSYATAVAKAEAAQAEADAAEAEGEPEGEQGEAEGEQAAEGGGRCLSTYINCDLCTEYECLAINDDDAAADEIINFLFDQLSNMKEAHYTKEDFSFVTGMERGNHLSRGETFSTCHKVTLLGEENADL
jgi:hypothetical protein